MTIKTPWFRCFPDQLLSALIGMPPQVKTVYLVILLRIYADAGPVREDDRRLAVFCDMRPNRVRKHINTLVEMGRLVRLEGGLICNKQAVDEITRQEEFSHKQSENRKAGWAAKGRSANEKRTDGGRMADKSRTNRDKPNEIPQQNQGLFDTKLLPIEKEEEREDSSLRSESNPPSLRYGGSRARATPKRSLPDDFDLTADRLSFAVQKGHTDESARREFEHFRGSALAHDRRYADWNSAWQNWVRNSLTRFAPAHGHASNGHRQTPRGWFGAAQRAARRVHDA